MIILPKVWPTLANATFTYCFRKSEEIEKITFNQNDGLYAALLETL